MRKHKKSQEKPKTLKRRLMAATSMLLVSAVLLVMTSYAWLIMSVAPEVTGITTNVAANGSLEIALLTTETRQDLTTIKTSIGQSLALNKTTANNTWGNLIDLNDKSYGLGEIALLPARLNAQKTGDNYRVDPGILSVPTYGYDGRIIELSDDTLSAVYGDNKFAAILGVQDYGVRAIGTSSAVSVQGSALALAKANIVTFTNSARTEAASALRDNIEALLGIVIAHSADSEKIFTDDDLNVVKAMIQDLQGSVEYIDLATRQGIVAVAASTVGDEKEFTAIRDLVNSATPLEEILVQIQNMGVDTLPSEFVTWVTELGELQNSLNHASNNANALTGGAYTWAQLRKALDPVMNVDAVYINDKLFSNMSASELTGLMGSGEVKMTLPSGSGVLGDIADFTDDFVVNMTMIGTAFEITTMTLINPPYLTALYDAVKGLEAADGSTEGQTEVTLSAMYGYALDMAFRCNAPLSDLLLQTTPEQRIYADSNAPSTMGGGSYMEFTTNAKDYSLEKMIALMDAVRVGFLDDQGILLKVAKLNVSNRIVTDDIVQAPLYLYDFSLSEDAEDYGAMIMGERRKTDNIITALEQSVAKAITVAVWLDGDIVDNSMVASSSSDGLSLSGVLNLQFASSADLVAAGNNDLMYVTPDKSELLELVTESRTIYDAGQGSYTTVSWEAYSAAHEFATAINNNSSATEAQVLKAATLLTQAKAGLQKVDLTTLRDKIASLRTWMGRSDDLARYVMYNSETKTYYSINPYTMEQKDQKIGEIYRVDYTKNLHDEGNGVMTPIYTDASWSSLAAALYDAEVVSNINQSAGFRELDDAITALDVAYKALERRVFYVPYEYEGRIYYFAISDETDTYGKWYDSDFKRVVSDLRILELDARAELAEVAIIQQDGNIKYNSTEIAITPYIDLMSDMYPDLAKDEIIAIHWGVTDHFTQAMTLSQKAYLETLIERAEALNAMNQAEYSVATDLIVNAEAVLATYETITLDTATKVAAEEAIAALENAVLTAEKAKAEKDAADAADAAASIDKNTADMTSEQRIVLTTAVTNAKAISGYSDDTNTEFDQLRADVKAAEDLLALESGATMQMAEDELAKLNAHLTDNGQKEVTEYNTIQHMLPTGTEIYEVGYATDLSATLLRPTKNTGRAEIKAIVLTKNGMLFVARKTVTVYAPADGVEFEYTATAPAGGTVTQTKEDGKTVYTWDGNIQASATWTITVDLIPCSDDPGLDAEGNAIDLSVGETIENCTWASSTTRVLRVSGSGADCTITAVAPGTATVSVSVETVQGNIYTTSVVVTVTVPAVTDE